jgi:hypothetical protein
MTTEDATALANLLEKSTDGLTPDGLTPPVVFWSTDTEHLQLRQLVFERRQVAIGGV